MVAYVRVSTAEQAQSGLGLAAQEERVRAYATMAGLDLLAIVRDEAVSGGNPIASRDGGAELLQLIRKGKVGHVVALKLDRLFRDAADCLTQTRAWDKAGVALHLLDMGGQSINTATAMNLVGQLLDVFLGREVLPVLSQNSADLDLGITPPHGSRS